MLGAPKVLSAYVLGVQMPKVAPSTPVAPSTLLGHTFEYYPYIAIRAVDWATGHPGQPKVRVLSA